MVRRERKTKRQINIECIDLDDDSDSDEEPAEISIIDDDEDDEVCELIETVRITPDSETEIGCRDEDNENVLLGKLEVSSIENNAKYQPKVFLKDICKEMSRDKTEKTMNESVTIEEITLEEDDEEERGSPHIRNLLKEFEVSLGKENKRKENFEDSSPKKLCLDELLLAEEILAQDIMEVTIEESDEVIDVEDDSVVICDNFPSKEILNEDDSEEDISIIVLV